MVLIIDTDPGVDDMLAMLLLLSTPKIQHELKLISLTYGNCQLSDTLNNVLSLFHVINEENKWRATKNLKPFTDQRPAIYLGCTRAFTSTHDDNNETYDESTKSHNDDIDATDVHGADGLAGIHSSHPEFDAPAEWFKYFNKGTEPSDHPELPFSAGGSKHSYKAILEILATEPANTVTIICIGPLTNLSKAIQTDPKTFSRVKEVLSMGGALRHYGNVTPLAEFNVLADPIAAAQVYSMTSKNPKVTLPAGSSPQFLELPDPLRLVIFPLDITESHEVKKSDVEDIFGGVLQRYPDCMLAKWIYYWMESSFVTYGNLVGLGPNNAVCQLHDPVTAAYAIEIGAGNWAELDEDVRVEASGTWCLGKTVVDDRGRARSEHNRHDIQKWLTLGEGNNVTVIKETPFRETFKTILLERIVGI